MFKICKEVSLILVFFTAQGQVLNILNPVFYYTNALGFNDIEPSTSKIKVQTTTLSTVTETVSKNQNKSAFTESSGHVNKKINRSASDSNIVKGIQEIEKGLEYVEKHCDEIANAQDADLAPEMKIVCNVQPSHTPTTKNALKSIYGTKKTTKIKIVNTKIALEDLKKSLGLNKPSDRQFVPEFTLTPIGYSEKNTDKDIKQAQKVERSNEFIIKNNQKENFKVLKNNSTSGNKKTTFEKTLATEFKLSKPFITNSDIRKKDEDHLHESVDDEFELKETTKYSLITQSYRDISIINTKDVQNNAEPKNNLYVAANKVIKGEKPILQGVNETESEDDSIYISNIKKYYSATPKVPPANDEITRKKYTIEDTQVPDVELITTDFTKVKMLKTSSTVEKPIKNILRKEYFDSESDVEESTSQPTTDENIKSDSKVWSPDLKDEENDSDSVTELGNNNERYETPNSLAKNFPIPRKIDSNEDDDATKQTTPRYSMKPIVWKGERNTMKSSTTTIENSIKPVILYDSKLVLKRNNKKIAKIRKNHIHKVNIQEQSDADDNSKDRTKSKGKSDINTQHMISIKNYKPKNIFNNPTIILKGDSEFNENDSNNDGDSPDVAPKVYDGKQKNKQKAIKEFTQDNNLSPIAELLNIMQNYVKDKMSEENPATHASALDVIDSNEGSQVNKLGKPYLVQTTKRFNVVVTKKQMSIKTYIQNSGDKALTSQKLEGLLNTMLVNLKKMIDKRDKSMTNFNWLSSGVNIQVGIEKILRLCENKNAPELDAKLIAFTDGLFLAALDCLPSELRNDKLDSTALYFREILNHLLPLYKVMDTASVAKKDNAAIFDALKKTYLYTVTDQKLMTILMHSAVNRIIQQIDAKFQDARVNDKLNAVLAGSKPDNDLKITYIKGDDTISYTRSDDKLKVTPMVDITKTYADIIEDMVLVYTILNQFLTTQKS